MNLTDINKPFKGHLRNAMIQTFPDGRYIYWGTFDGHPQFNGRRGHTSQVVAEHPGGIVETLNSVYIVEMSTDD